MKINLPDIIPTSGAKTRRELNILSWDIRMKAHQDYHVFVRGGEGYCLTCLDNMAQVIIINFLCQWDNLKREDIINFYRSIKFQWNSIYNIRYIFSYLIFKFKLRKIRNRIKNQFSQLIENSVIEEKDGIICLTEEYKRLVNTNKIKENIWCAYCGQWGDHSSGSCNLLKEDLGE